MNENPYQSPEPPEEPVYFRERGHAWPGWRKIGRVGAVSFFSSILVAIGLAALKRLSGFNPSWYVSLVFLVFFVGGLSLFVLSRVGAYLHSVVLMFRDEYH